MFDMDMSAGDFLALFYLLKVPIEEIYLKVTGSFTTRKLGIFNTIVINFARKHIKFHFVIYML